MKKIIFVTIFLTAGICFAQDETEVTYQQETDKTLALRLNPVGLMFGVSNLGVDVPLTDRATIGGQLSYFQLEGDAGNEANAFSYGVRGQFFFNQVYTDSWYLAGFFDVLNADAENTLTAEKGTVSGFSTGLFIGYMWGWDYFNIQLGGGIQSVELDNVGTQSTVDVASINGVSPALEFNLGLAF